MFEQSISGRVFLFGKNIDTDQIYPGRFVELTDVADVAKHAMEGADPDFVKKFAPGDVIVAGSNFGCGSSREHAAIALKAIGTGVVIADSFARIFFRNAVNMGLPLLVCKNFSSTVREGERISVDVVKGGIADAHGNTLAQAEPLSDYVRHILAHGGIKPLLQQQFSGAQRP